MSNLAEPEKWKTVAKGKFIVSHEIVGADYFEDRECPECEGTGYDVDDTPCEYCYGEGIM